FFLAESFLTKIAYTKSDLPLASSSSSSLHSLSHHFSLAFWVSLLSSLFSCLYFFFPYTVFLLFHFLLYSIFSSIFCVIHGFFASLPFLIPICTFSLSITSSLILFLLFSTVAPSSHFTRSSIL